MVRDEERRMELIPNGFDIIEVAGPFYHPFDRDQSLTLVHPTLLSRPGIRACTFDSLTRVVNTIGDGAIT
jgi:hypothetical protein